MAGHQGTGVGMNSLKYILMEQIIGYPTEIERNKEKDIVSLRPFSAFNSQTAVPVDVAVIVAMGLDRAIGRRGDMPWHIPADLKRFKALTMGHPVIMGRRTWLSLPKGALPGRRNIVVTTDRALSLEGAETASSPEEALAMCARGPMPFVIGGGRLYESMMPFATRLYLTVVDAEFPDADTWFPEFRESDWKPSGEDVAPGGVADGLGYRFVNLLRR